MLFIKIPSIRSFLEVYNWVVNHSKVYLSKNLVILAHLKTRKVGDKTSRTCTFKLSKVIISKEHASRSSWLPFMSENGHFVNGIIFMDMIKIVHWGACYAAISILFKLWIEDDLRSWVLFAFQLYEYRVHIRKSNIVIIDEWHSINRPWLITYDFEVTIKVHCLTSSILIHIYH